MVFIDVWSFTFPMLEAVSNVKEEKHMISQETTEDLQRGLLCQFKVLQKVNVLGISAGMSRGKSTK